MRFIEQNAQRCIICCTLSLFLCKWLVHSYLRISPLHYRIYALLNEYPMIKPVYVSQLAFLVLTHRVGMFPSVEKSKLGIESALFLHSKLCVRLTVLGVYGHMQY